MRVIYWLVMCCYVVGLELETEKASNDWGSVGLVVLVVVLAFVCWGGGGWWWGVGGAGEGGGGGRGGL